MVFIIHSTGYAPVADTDKEIAMPNEINFNPEPSFGSNPFQPVLEGVNLGLGLQREQRALQAFEDQKRIQEEERKILATERRNKSFQEGIGLLKDKKFLAGFPTELKNDVIRKKIAPYLTQDLGLPMDDSITFKDVEPIMNEAINIFESSAPSDMKREALVKLMARADPEERKELKELSDFAFPKSSQFADIQSERLRNLEEERNVREREREIGRYRQYLLDIEQRDPIIKEANKQDLSLNAVNALQRLTEEGNTVAFSGLGTKMARGMGEVGVLTEQDIKRYVRSGRLDRKAADTLSSWVRGRPTEATLSEIGQITDVINDSFQSKLQPRYDRYIETYSKQEGVTPEEFASKLSLPYSGVKSENETKEQRKARLIKELKGSR